MSQSRKQLFESGEVKKQIENYIKVIAFLYDFYIEGSSHTASEKTNIKTNIAYAARSTAQEWLKNEAEAKSINVVEKLKELPSVFLEKMDHELLSLGIEVKPRTPTKNKQGSPSKSQQIYQKFDLFSTEYRDSFNKRYLKIIQPILDLGLSEQYPDTENRLFDEIFGNIAESKTDMSPAKLELLEKTASLIVNTKKNDIIAQQKSGIGQEEKSKDKDEEKVMDGRSGSSGKEQKISVRERVKKLNDAMKQNPTLRNLIQSLIPKISKSYLKETEDKVVLLEDTSLNEALISIADAINNSANLDTQTGSESENVKAIEKEKIKENYLNKVNKELHTILQENGSSEELQKILKNPTAVGKLNRAIISAKAKSQANFAVQLEKLEQADKRSTQPGLASPYDQMLTQLLKNYTTHNEKSKLNNKKNPVSHDAKEIPGSTAHAAAKTQFLRPNAAEQKQTAASSLAPMRTQDNQNNLSDSNNSANAENILRRPASSTTSSTTSRLNANAASMGRSTLTGSSLRNLSASSSTQRTDDKQSNIGALNIVTLETQFDSVFNALAALQTKMTNNSTINPDEITHLDTRIKALKAIIMSIPDTTNISYRVYHAQLENLSLGRDKIVQFVRAKKVTAVIKQKPAHRETKNDETAALTQSIDEWEDVDSQKEIPLDQVGKNKSTRKQKTTSKPFIDNTIKNQYEAIYNLIEYLIEKTNDLHDSVDNLQLNLTALSDQYKEIIEDGITLWKDINQLEIDYGKTIDVEYYNKLLKLKHLLDTIIYPKIQLYSDLKNCEQKVLALSKELQNLASPGKNGNDIATLNNLNDTAKNLLLALENLDGTNIATNHTTLRDYNLSLIKQVKDIQDYIERMILTVKDPAMSLREDLADLENDIIVLRNKCNGSNPDWDALEIESKLVEDKYALVNEAFIHFDYSKLASPNSIDDVKNALPEHRETLNQIQRIIAIGQFINQFKLDVNALKAKCEVKTPEPEWTKLQAEAKELAEINYVNIINVLEELHTEYANGGASEPAHKTLKRQAKEAKDLLDSINTNVIASKIKPTPGATATSSASLDLDRLVKILGEIKARLNLNEPISDHALNYETIKFEIDKAIDNRNVNDLIKERNKLKLEPVPIYKIEHVLGSYSAELHTFQANLSLDAAYKKKVEDYLQLYRASDALVKTQMYFPSGDFTETVDFEDAYGDPTKENEIITNWVNAHSKGDTKPGGVAGVSVNKASHGLTAGLSYKNFRASGFEVEKNGQKEHVLFTQRLTPGSDLAHCVLHQLPSFLEPANIFLGTLANLISPTDPSAVTLEDQKKLFSLAQGIVEYHNRTKFPMKKCIEQYLDTTQFEQLKMHIPAFDNLSRSNIIETLDDQYEGTLGRRKPNISDWLAQKLGYEELLPCDEYLDIARRMIHKSLESNYSLIFTPDGKIDPTTDMKKIPNSITLTHAPNEKFANALAHACLQLGIQPHNATGYTIYAHTVTLNKAVKENSQLSYGTFKSFKDHAVSFKNAASYLPASKIVSSSEKIPDNVSFLIDLAKNYFDKDTTMSLASKQQALSGFKYALVGKQQTLPEFKNASVGNHLEVLSEPSFKKFAELVKSFTVNDDKDTIYDQLDDKFVKTLQYVYAIFVLNNFATFYASKHPGKPIPIVIDKSVAPEEAKIMLAYAITQGWEVAPNHPNYPNESAMKSFKKAFDGMKPYLSLLEKLPTPPISHGGPGHGPSSSTT